MACLTLTRKIATIALIVWKRGASFDAQHLKPQFLRQNSVQTSPKQIETLRAIAGRLRVKWALFSKNSMPLEANPRRIYSYAKTSPSVTGYDSGMASPHNFMSAQSSVAAEGIIRGIDTPLDLCPALRKRTSRNKGR
jgi:hypothetical protein